METVAASGGFFFQGTLGDAANFGLAIAILAGGATSIFYIFVGGVQFITSGGDEEKTKRAVKTVRYSLIGLLVVIFAVTLVAILGAIFNFELTALINWGKMMDILNGISDRFTHTNTSSIPSE